MASLPICLPFMGALRGSATGTDGAEALVAPLSTSFLASMFAALAVLFVCLLRTGASGVSRAMVRAGAGLYVLGYASLVVAALRPDLSDRLSLLGAPLGVGAVTLMLAWASRLRWASLRSSLAGVTPAFLLVCAIYLALAIVGASQVVRVLVLAALATAGSVGTCLTVERGGSKTERRVPEEDTNWWDIFGRFDVTPISGSEEYATPLSRVLFFVVTPLLVLMLLASPRGAFDADVAGWETLAGVCLAAALCLPLLLAKTDRGLITLAFRTYLPAMALVSTSLGAFLEGGAGAVALRVGTGAYCTLYSVLFASLVLSTPGRMRSLALPCAGFLALAADLAALMLVSPWDAAQMVPLQPLLECAYLTASALLLMATPGAHMWLTMMDLIPLEGPAAPEPSLAEMRLQLARERGLTEREAEVFAYLTRGHGSSYIAARIGVSESTVRSHRTNIYRKLGVGSREELFALVDAWCRRADPRDAGA